MKINKKPKNFAVWMLVVLLAGTAFAGGRMWTKIKYLERGEKVAKKVITAKKAVGKPRQDTAQLDGKIAINSADHIRGNKKASVTMVEFSDFQCPFCRRFHPTMQRIMKEYRGKVRWVYRHFPLSFHKNAQKSAEASECAGEQGKFWEYADRVFESSQADGTGLDLKDLKKYADELGLDVGKFNNCLVSGKFADKVRADMVSGRAVGVSGTPGTILIDKDSNAQLISGALPFEQIKAKIEAVLK